MTKITIDDKEYDIESMTDEQKRIINVLGNGQSSLNLMSHIIQCIQSVQQIKVTELKESIKDVDS